MKIKFIVLGAVFIVILMISSGTAVSKVYSKPLMDKISRIEEIQINYNEFIEEINKLELDNSENSIREGFWAIVSIYMGMFAFFSGFMSIGVGWFFILAYYMLLFSPSTTYEELMNWRNFTISWFIFFLFFLRLMISSNYMALNEDIKFRESWELAQMDINEIIDKILPLHAG